MNTVMGLKIIDKEKEKLDAIYQIQVYNAIGQMLYVTTWKDTTNDIVLDFSAFKNGLYVIKSK